MKKIINLINNNNEKLIKNHISRYDTPDVIRTKIQKAIANNSNNISTEITPNFLKDDIKTKEYEFFCQNFTYVIDFNNKRKKSNNKSKIIYMHDTKKCNNLIISEVIKKKEAGEKEFMLVNTNKNDINEIDFNNTDKIYLNINCETTNEDSILNKILFNDIELAVINADINLRIKLYLHGLKYHDIDFDESKSIREFYKSFNSREIVESRLLNTDNLNDFVSSLKHNSENIRKIYKLDERYNNIIKRTWKKENNNRFNRYERYFIAKNIKFSGKHKRPIKSYFLSLLNSAKTSGWNQELEFFLEKNVNELNIDFGNIAITQSKSVQKSLLNTIIFYTFTTRNDSNFELLNNLLRHNVCNSFSKSLIVSFIKKKDSFHALIENLDFENKYNKEFHSLFLLILLKNNINIDYALKIDSVKKFLEINLFDLIDFLINGCYINMYDLIDLRNNYSLNLKEILNYLKISNELDFNKVETSISYRLIKSIYLHFDIEQFKNDQLVNVKIIEMFFYNQFWKLSPSYSYIFKRRHLLNQTSKLILFSLMYKFIKDRDIKDDLLIFANEIEKSIKVTDDLDYIYSVAYFKFKNNKDMVNFIVSKFWDSHFNFRDFENIFF